MAGKEASGTGNMKFAMNGALTIGTLDGANVEIRDAVGPEHFFLFGMTAPEVAARKAQGYRPRDVYESNAELRETLDLIGSGLFSNGDREMFQPLLHSLLERDEYMLLADYQDYVDAQQRVSERLGQPAGVDPHVHPQLRESRPVLVGPVDPGLLPGHLAHRSAGAGRSQW